MKNYQKKLKHLTILVRSSQLRTAMKPLLGVWGLLLFNLAQAQDVATPYAQTITTQDLERHLREVEQQKPPNPQKGLHCGA